MRADPRGEPSLETPTRVYEVKPREQRFDDALSHEIGTGRHGPLDLCRDGSETGREILGLEEHRLDVDEPDLRQHLTKQPLCAGSMVGMRQDDRRSQIMSAPQNPHRAGLDHRAIGPGTGENLPSWHAEGLEPSGDTVRIRDRVGCVLANDEYRRFWLAALVPEDCGDRGARQ